MKYKGIIVGDSPAFDGRRIGEAIIKGDAKKAEKLCQESHLKWQRKIAIYIKNTSKLDL